MENDKNPKWLPSIWKKVYISTKKPRLKNIPTSLKVTIKGFNIDSEYFISAECEMYNKVLSLYFIPPFEQFPTFFSEYKQDFSLMLTLYGINLCYYFYIFSSNF